MLVAPLLGPLPTHSSRGEEGEIALSSTRFAFAKLAPGSITWNTVDAFGRTLGTTNIMVEAKENPAMKGTDAYLAKFDRFEKEAKQPSWLFPLRKAGLARFAEVGFPTLRDEDWRFTNVAPIAKLPFKPVFESSRNGFTPEGVAQLSFGELEASRLVFVDGHFVAGLSSPGPQPEGVIVCNLAEALTTHSALLEKHLARHAQSVDNAFTALNTAFFQDGVFIYVPAGKSVPAPVHLLFLSTAKEAGATSHPRNLIIAEKDSRVTVLETYAGEGDTAYFTNAVTELILGEGAVVEHCKFQDESASAFHVAAVHAHLGRGCNFISHSIATGARLSRKIRRIREPRSLL